VLKLPIERYKVAKIDRQ
jgi:hypothetical protein